MSRADAHFRLRLPHDLREWLKQEADRNLRSMTSEIILALRERAGKAKTAPDGAGTPARA